MVPRALGPSKGEQDCNDFSLCKADMLWASKMILSIVGMLLSLWLAMRYLHHNKSKTKQVSPATISKRTHVSKTSDGGLQISSIPQTCAFPIVPARLDFCGHDLFRELYFKLQNLENHTEILPAAYETLRTLLIQPNASEKLPNTGDDILAISQYTVHALEDFLAAEHTNVLDQYERYQQRKQSGGGPELFSTRIGAEKWLVRNAPIKYVDGAWLGHIHRVTTPFALRPITKEAWQVLSEELGDGDARKNHVRLYQQTLHSVGIHLPPGDSADFVQPGLGMEDGWVWKAAAGQLLISLFPNDFLPEILGFNLHYELLTLETLKATKELPLFGISAAYFLLHISIDNADSGHTAMALHIVETYLESVRETEGVAAEHDAWKRVQAGYQLSKTLGEAGHRAMEGYTPPLSEQENRIVKILKQKAGVSGRIHCMSRVRIGKQTLTEWLSDEHCGDDRAQKAWLSHLADASPWIVRGNSESSRLIGELSWGGKMYGAFTHAEIEHMKTWITSLEPIRHMPGGDVAVEDTWQAVTRDVVRDYPVFQVATETHSIRDLCSRVRRACTVDLDFPAPPLDLGKGSLETLLPLWFTHSCLLENFVSIPYRTSTPFASHIIRILRAELGFAPETDDVAGTDYLRITSSHLSLHDLGMAMMCQDGLPEPKCLEDVVGELRDTSSHAVTLAHSMLSWSIRPLQNSGLLLGLSRAFLDLECWVAETDLLGQTGKEALHAMIVRKETSFRRCVTVLQEDKSLYADFLLGYHFGRAEIESIFEA